MQVVEVDLVSNALLVQEETVVVVQEEGLMEE
jgi:hypothetical protein